MSVFDLDRRVFVPVHNTVGGAVSDATRFTFKQSRHEISANYEGGDVTAGHILGKFTKEDTAKLVYHCRSVAGELKSGEALAHFSVNEAGIMYIDMQWRWLNGDKLSGTSHYEEVSR